jgi:hypothetical protein
MQPSIGHTATHLGASPSHSVQAAARIAKAAPFAAIAAFGHSNSQAPQAVHSAAMMARAMALLRL